MCDNTVNLMMVLEHPSVKKLGGMRSAFLRFAFFMKNTTKILAINALVAALYVVLTMPFGVITTSSGMQFRPAEALTILPALMPYTIWGLAVGCGLSNFVSAFGLPDIILGSLTTLAAAYLTSKIKKPWLAALPPVLLNAAFMPLIWMISSHDIAYWVHAGSMLLTQAAVIYGIGMPLYYIMKKYVMPHVALPAAERKNRRQDNR